jgi:Uma2 family endonuclease
MRVLFLEAPQDLLDERRRIGADRRDEMWNGVLHLVPLGSGPRQQFSAEFLMLVGPLVKRRGLKMRYYPGFFRTDDDYRVPDFAIFREGQSSERGVEAADLVVELRDPGDETYEKIDFYADRGVQEMLILHPEERRAEIYRAYGSRLLPVLPALDGVLGSDVLRIRMGTVDGKLRITWDGGSADI